MDSSHTEESGAQAGGRPRHPTGIMKLDSCIIRKHAWNNKAACLPACPVKITPHHILVHDMDHWN